jgi:tetratricopeptide (TPR) repeat protein
MIESGAAVLSAASRWVKATLALALLLLPASVLADTGNLEKCAARVRDDPDQLESYMCYWFAARKGEAAGADRALQALLSIDPSNHRARLYLGAIRADRGDPSAESLYRKAADGFADWGESTGEVYALLSLCHFLEQVGRPDEADEVLERAAGVAREAGDNVLLARAVAFQSSRAMWRGAYGEALRLLSEAERAVFPDGPVDLRAGILARMGEAYWAQGLLERAREAYTREADLMAEAGDPHVEAVARLNVAFVSDDLVQTGRIEREEIVADLERAVQAAHQIGDLTAEGRARLLLASWSEPTQAVAEIGRSRAIYEQTGNRRSARLATRRLAAALWHYDPQWREEALRLIDEAIEDARLVGDLQELARGLSVKAGMLQEAASREEWIGAYADVLEAIEKIRDLQPSGTVGARLFSRWTGSYYRFTGGLLRGLGGSPDPAGDLELAFHTIERMRARSLLDEMDGAGAQPPTEEEVPEATLREEVLRQIAETQKRLADPELAGAERSSALEELERLETEEALLRDAVARVDPVFAAWRAPTIPTIEEVQQALAPDQAVLSFQLAEEMSRGAAPVFRGGSWVVAVTRDDARVFALPEERAVRELVTIFLGLCRRRDGSEAAAGTRLFEELLAEPLRSMGPAVRRLVLVPDGSLHALPFAALRPRADADPIGVTHEIARTPSVTLWMRWREEPGEAVEPTGRGTVLALADPELPGSATPDALRAAKPWIEGLRLGCLPHARAEARALVRSLDGDSHLAYGAEASERFLKQAELKRFRILHLATHAVVDDEHPERSAVVLTPGDEEEDGFLQVREIVELDVRNKVVILSSCRSASGTVLRGEGVQGLARGFLQAGARGVVGNLWPLRDDDAELLVRELGQGLGRGRSIAAALAEARAARVEAGAPAAAWAGLVLLGDGDFAPISARGGRPGG